MRVRGSAKYLFLLFATLLGLGASASSASAARPDDQAVLSPVDFEVLNRPSPVRGADNRQHLVYEIQAVNQSAMDVTVRKIAARTQGRVLGQRLVGAGLSERMRINSGAAGTTLGPGGSAMIFLDIAYNAKRRPFSAISHAISLSWPDSANPGEEINQTFIGVSSRVSRLKPLVLSSPVKGRNWVAVNGCCTPNAHRGATLAIDGTVRVPERFAIDFVQLDGEDRLFQGSKQDLFSYPYYRASVFAAASGRVVAVKRGLPEQIPGSLPAGATIQMAGGNYVVVRIGRGQYAFYAHLATGSVRVREGQRVRRGQVLGLLGNTGNTDGPHLHFHVMNSPSPLQSSGLPFVFRSFAGRGVLENVVGIQDGDPGEVNTNRLRGAYRRSLPMENQVLRFG